MLRESIKNQLVAALKEHDEAKVSILRLINAAIKDKDIAARPAGKTDGISDADILQLLQSMIKQRKESIEMYEKGGRADLVAKEQGEVNVIASFLPKQMDEAAMREAIKAVIAQTGAASIKDMGKVMGALRAQYAGQMDFGQASALIKEMLAA
ncbi:MAG: GatB/YqeY domain-containing protein [Alphaproteobacteria bacterium]|nr:GatB/YqeY domain-containing protein [Alphaproteobacteria bacterium]